jgi:hemerythrin
MAFLQWSEKYSVNVGEIDGQHRALIEMINSLHEALLARKGREAQQTIVNKMVEYAHSHFQTEEKYMQQFHFIGYQAHKFEHDHFKKKALELKERLETTGFVLTLEILNFLKDWLQNHILVSDKTYASHFNDHGLY